jgi:hypothetical protein
MREELFVGSKRSASITIEANSPAERAEVMSGR